jgi:hypothetical protein
MHFNLDAWKVLIMGVIEFLKTLGHATPDTWVYWPLVIVGFSTGIFGLVIFFGAIGHALRFIYQGNRYIFWAVLICTTLLLFFLTNWEVTTLVTIAGFTESVFLWIMIPFGFVVGIVTGGWLVIQILKELAD